MVKQTAVSRFSAACHGYLCQFSGFTGFRELVFFLLHAEIKRGITLNV